MRWPPKFVCQHGDCDLFGQPQDGDKESVYFAILCVRCMRPVHAFAAEEE